jgi:hypothetical protein
MKRGNVGLAYDGKKPAVVSDMYRSTEVKGGGTPVVPRTTPHTGPRPVKNQYGENRTLAGGKGKK